MGRRSSGSVSRTTAWQMVGRSLTARHVLAMLEALAATRGLPQTIAVDYGTEFTSSYSRLLDECVNEE